MHYHLSPRTMDIDGGPLNDLMADMIVRIRQRKDTDVLECIQQMGLADDQEIARSINMPIETVRECLQRLCEARKIQTAAQGKYREFNPKLP